EGEEQVARLHRPRVQREAGDLHAVRLGTTARLGPAACQHVHHLHRVSSLQLQSTNRAARAWPYGRACSSTVTCEPLSTLDPGPGDCPIARPVPLRRGSRDAASRRLTASRLTRPVTSGTTTALALCATSVTGAAGASSGGPAARTGTGA